MTSKKNAKKAVSDVATNGEMKLPSGAIFTCAVPIDPVTMNHVGRVKAIGLDFLTLDYGGWGVGTARSSRTLEIEKFNEWPWPYDVLRTTK